MTSVRNTLVVIIATVVSFTVSALEPLTDRARLASMQGQLLLPDGSYLPVDMSFDCGSQWENTAMIITSDLGAQLLAAAYTQLYGNEAGRNVIRQWNNKTKSTDPRKPSFLIITPPAIDQEKQSWKSITELDTLSSETRSLNKRKSLSLRMPPVVTASCGTRVHTVE